jgi:signal peptidase I
MSPALKIGDAFIVDSRLDPINRFDIVVYKPQPVKVKLEGVLEGVDENTRFVHRVIGLSGEKIEIKKGRVFVNDAELSQPFETFKSEDDFGPIVVPEGEFFLLGDNRSQSLDSRYWKNPTIKRADISGKVGQIYPGFYKK